MINTRTKTNSVFWSDAFNMLHIISISISLLLFILFFSTVKREWIDQKNKIFNEYTGIDVIFWHYYKKLSKFCQKSISRSSIYGSHKFIIMVVGLMITYHIGQTPKWSENKTWFLLLVQHFFRCTFLTVFLWLLLFNFTQMCIWIESNWLTSVL